jgi:CrcB protein
MVAVEPAHLVGTGGAIGALLRSAVSARLDSEQLPAGTLAVNVVGSFVLAVLTFLGVGSDVVLLVGTGACGSFTTFSSFAVDTVELWETDRRVRAAGNAVGTLGGALAAIGLAWLLVGLFT